MGQRSLDPERGRLVAARLHDLGVEGILITAAERGYITELKCQVEPCLCPAELGGVRHFEESPPELSDWMATVDHFPKPRAKQGKLTLDNARLAHRLCNRVDASKREGRSYKRDLARVEAARAKAVEASGPNPWTATPGSRPFVVREDRAHVEVWNEQVGTRKPGYRLHLEVLPEPAVGQRGAPLVVLGRNPGWSGTEPAEQRVLRRRQALRANLDDDPTGHLHPYLTDAFAATAGGRWWRKCMRAVARDSGQTYEDLARLVLSVEFHGYHSVSYAPLSVTLPSQEYGFHLVARAVRRDAIIVITRGWTDWHVAVPTLRNHRRVFRLNNPRSSTISRANLSSGAFEQIVTALSR